MPEDTPNEEPAYFTVKYWLEDGTSHTYGSFETHKAVKQFVKNLEVKPTRWDIKNPDGEVVETLR